MSDECRAAYFLRLMTLDGVRCNEGGARVCRAERSAGYEPWCVVLRHARWISRFVGSCRSRSMMGGDVLPCYPELTLTGPVPKPLAVVHGIYVVPTQMERDMGSHD